MNFSHIYLLVLTMLKDSLKMDIRLAIFIGSVLLILSVILLFIELKDYLGPAAMQNRLEAKLQRIMFGKKIQE